jgi:Domain of unknown function (DUF4646)
LYVPSIPNPIATNKHSRHELVEQTTPQIAQRISQYTALSFTPFSIPTDTDSLSSGFPYTQRLDRLRITRDQWHQFSLEVVNAAKLSFSEDAAAWATGVGTGAASSAFLLVFGPAVGYYTGKAVHKKTVVKKVKEKLAQDGDLRNVLRRWNEGSFRERGIQVWMEAPSEQVAVDAQPGMSSRDMEKEVKKMQRRFRIVVQPFDPRSAPLGQGSWGSEQSPVSPGSSHPVHSSVQMAQGQGWASNQAPVKPYMAPSQQSQSGSVNQQLLGHDGKPMGMVQELPGSTGKSYTAPVQQGWGNQQTAQLDGKQTEMVQELPGTLGRPFIAELDGGDFQQPPELPPKVPPKLP